MGWNSLHVSESRQTVFEGIWNEHPYVYFVHSYYLKAEEEEHREGNDSSME